MKLGVMRIKGGGMLTITDTQILVVTSVLLAIAGIVAYTFGRDAATQRKRLAYVPARVREQRRQAPLLEEKSREISPSVYYLGILVIAYLIAMIFLLA
ncbi:MAG TPA: hypothetical protein VLH85_09710 [Levilinea sp.]|nr:hypothetical protein [Levilinea sp.]